MPTYQITYANVLLSQEMKAEIATSIASAHQRGTGAPSFLAEVIFAELGRTDHYIGGQLNTSPHILVHGFIRSGRSAETKKALISDVISDTSSIANVNPESIWVYIQDLEAEQMAEFGRLLPQPGHEASWVGGLSDEKRADLQRMGMNVEQPMR